MTKSEASLKLDDEITAICIASEKAHMLMSDLTNEYFGTAPRNHQEEMLKLHDLNRYRVISDIIFDYVYKIKEIAEKMQNYER